MTEAAFHVCAICGRFLVEVVCPVCKGQISEEDSPTCWGCIGTGTMWQCPVCDADDEPEIEPEAELTRDEFLAALREAWDDVVHHRTHILHDFTNFFKDELGEE